MVGILLLCPRSGVGPAMLAQRYTKRWANIGPELPRCPTFVCWDCCVAVAQTTGYRLAAEVNRQHSGVCVYNKDMGSSSTVIIMIIVQNTDSPFTIHRLAE